MIIDVIIPAYNEENAVGKVVKAIPKDLVREIVVVNNNSSDETSTIAGNAGATVLMQRDRGYGNACLKGIEYLKLKDEGDPDVVVFLDADFSDFPEEMVRIVAPIQQGKAELVIGSRALGKKEKGSMLIQQRFGNWLATTLIHRIYKYRYTDLGPFRAIRMDKLELICMRDRTYGWTVEMQLKALKHGLLIQEVPVSYRKRIGKSKITGTVSGTLGAGWKILATIWKYRK